MQRSAFLLFFTHYERSEGPGWNSPYVQDVGLQGRERWWSEAQQPKERLCMNVVQLEQQLCPISDVVRRSL